MKLRLLISFLDNLKLNKLSLNKLFELKRKLDLKLYEVQIAIQEKENIQ